MPGYEASSGVDFNTALKEARKAYGSNLDQSFSYKGQSFNAGTGMLAGWSLSAGNNKMPNNQDSIKSQGIKKSKGYNEGTGQGFSGEATSYGTQGGSSVTSAQVRALQDKPTSDILIPKAGTFSGQAKTFTDTKVNKLDVSSLYGGNETEKGNEYYADFNASQKTSTVDQSFLESSLDTSVPEVAGALTDEDLLATMQPQSDQPSFSEMYNKSRAYDTPAGFDKSIGDFDPSMARKRVTGIEGFGKSMSGTESFRSLPHEGVGSSGFFAGAMAKGKDMAGKAGGMLGKAGDFMKGPGGQGVMAGLNILGEAGAMAARKKAIGSLGQSMASLETTMEQSTATRIAGFDAAEDAFQQGKGLVGTRLADSMKGAFAGVKGSNIATGSRDKVKKDIRGQVSNQADMAIAGLETQMAKGKAGVLQQSRGDRSKAKSALADAKAKQEELKQQQKMGPLKMAASVVSVVNPAAGMALNAGLSLYDAYST